MKFYRLLFALFAAFATTLRYSQANPVSYASTRPQFTKRGNAVQITISENLGANAPHALSQALRRYPQINRFRITFFSGFASNSVSTATYDKKNQFLRLWAKTGTAEYTYLDQYLFKKVSVENLHRLGAITREPNIAAPLGYFDELKNYGCTIYQRNQRRP